MKKIINKYIKHAVSLAAFTFTQVIFGSLNPHVINMSDFAIRQEGLTCGFHAIKNGKWMAEHVKGRINEGQLITKLLAEADTPDFPLAVWQATAGQEDNIFEEQGYNVAQIANIPLVDFTMLANIKEFDAAVMEDDHFDALCTVISKVQQKQPVTHIFVLGNMIHSTKDNMIQGMDGHWIAIVVHINNKQELQFHYIDSSGLYVNEDLVQQLSNLLEKDVQKLKTQKNLAHIIESSLNKINDGDPQACFTHLTKLFQEANEKKINLTNCAKVFKNQLMELLTTLTLFTYDQKKTDAQQAILVQLQHLID